MSAIALAEEVVDILILIDPVAVDAVEAVSYLQGLLPLIGAILPEFGNHRSPEGGGTPIEDEDYHKAQQKVHERTRHQYEGPLPGRLIGEGPGFIALLVFPGHGAEAPEGHRTQGIKGLPLLLLQQHRTHAHGKFLHLHSAEFCHSKMAQFMYDDQQSEQQYCKDDIKYAHLEKFSKT